VQRSGAERIRVRAIQRCGELLREMEPSRGAATPKAHAGGVPPQRFRHEAARDAGLSDDQRKTAIRVASVPQEQFEALTEAPSWTPAIGP
jgi:hypothetical protein